MVSLFVPFERDKRTVEVRFPNLRSSSGASDGVFTKKHRWLRETIDEREKFVSD
jgi:hypothetical protein